ncbi:4'-phosphopantetheinyl transferase superfamily protein [Tumebacillus sp. ITR2]|uniref:4'-phosphopantetheinyl transferase superfamily protein n=1 Tax=Tumebacillus amylolyticus TaxID=2801339 RepID=A0ABS1JAP1_9BACL|nr:4'-phosphopantetheinyl transferase superfamily protein [Tumebacillus amylolyticus]MBL0387348.1 4'-phosphopantetheinyl transferase superfamily protein [Tumebacillus amylolyticus]
MHPIEQTKVYWLQVPATLTVRDLADSLHILTEEERSVYNRFKVDHKKIEFLLGRALLKTQIGVRLGLPPAHVQFVKNDYGKLFLASGNPSSFHFNLTHSERVIACAFAPVPVGVDVEYTANDHLNVMTSVFTPVEQAYVQNSAPDVRLQAFYRIWTRKEAYVKAVGMGLSISPETFSVPIEDMGTGEWAYFTCLPVDPYVLSLAVPAGSHTPSESVHPQLRQIDTFELLGSLQSL